MGTTARIGLVLAMIALLFAGQLVEREFRRRRGEREPTIAAEYQDLLAPLPDAHLPARPAGHRPGAVTDGTRAPGAGAAALARNDEPAKAYVVQPGDTLGKIAKKLYGSEVAWKPIFEKNRALIPDPARLQVGAVLQIPPREKPAGR
ncbi:MAG TPA: LysM peptidoglycan-binding domain-containing protein [Planctomycetota bacterium]|nr:LysM peptidoglycan-binding domain-containing protein [Planctomycetota bacterium]